MKSDLLGCGTLLAVPLTIIFIVCSLNYSGFCWSKMRYLSDEEKFRLLFEMSNNRKTANLVFYRKNKIEYKSYQRIKYENFDNFMEKNPDCCAINPGGPYELPPPKFIDRITGFHNGEVVGMNYIVRYLDENGEQKSKKIETITVLQNCGEIKY